MTRATENLDAMIASLPPKPGPKMPFSVACGAYYALWRGFPRKLVAKAFDISEPTAALLAHAGDEGAKFYRKIGEEFRRLGAEAFAAAYYTPEIDDRLARIRMHVPQPGDIRPERAADIRANKWAKKPMRFEPTPGHRMTMEIDWRNHGDIDPRSGSEEPIAAGWTMRAIEGGDEQESQWSWRRWPTSSAARKYLLETFGEEVS